MCNMGVDPSQVEGAMNEEVERMKAEPIGDRELQKLKNQIEFDAATGNQSMAGIAESLANYHTYFGDANLINTEVERYLAVTPEDIQRVAQKYYVPEQRVTPLLSLPRQLSHELHSFPNFFRRPRPGLDVVGRGLHLLCPNRPKQSPRAWPSA